VTPDVSSASFSDLLKAAVARVPRGVPPLPARAQNE
jgi:hypothetical protein